MFGFSFDPLTLILIYVPSLACGIHVMRTGREMFWLWLFIIGPGIAPLIYFFVAIVPDLMNGRAVRKIGGAARHALDPERELRQAKQAFEDTPTAGSLMRAAHAAAALGRWQEAEGFWAQAGQGHWADDTAILMGHARTLIELGRYAEALRKLDHLRTLGKEGDTPQAALAFARIYEGLGRFDEADAPYRYAADRVPGLEAGARYVAFMAKSGRMADAKIGFTEIERRFEKVAGPLKAEARQWRDLAARAVST
jgi:hypothetical protein